MRKTTPITQSVKEFKGSVDSATLQNGHIGWEGRDVDRSNGRCAVGFEASELKPYRNLHDGVRHLADPTGSRSDHAHFRYGRLQLRFSDAFRSRTAAAGAFVLHGVIGPHGPYLAFEPQVRGPLGSGAMGGQSSGHQIFMTGYRVQGNSVGGDLRQGHRPGRGQSNTPNRKSLPLPVSEI
jgi:hypothetical protein